MTDDNDFSVDSPLPDETIAGMSLDIAEDAGAPGKAYPTGFSDEEVADSTQPLLPDAGDPG